LVSNHAFFYL
jgi:hypothetical protein